MFVNAIEVTSQFTRPIHTIYRSYHSQQVLPGSASLFFVNNQACAVTCKHVVELIINADKINQNYQNFKKETAHISRNGDFWQKLAPIEAHFQYQQGVMMQVKNTFMNCVDRYSSFEISVHPNHDLALVRFGGYGEIKYQNHAVFLKNTDEAKQGKFLCRLGYPFPEFNNFRYNANSDDIEWTSEGNFLTPTFPLEGMITRHLADATGLWGIEMSTPGLRGQSGGPLFDKDGVVYGMQSSTKHLHLGFDIENLPVMLNGVSTGVSNHPFLHVGQCVNAQVIKAFLKEKNVDFEER